ncbi:MAG: LysR family transcriptional regulator [Cycloclasticus sp. symbiont of Bathymodiolus heckerae]|nr:MAG: LysR family transcriptional regulator [Cycloclasticus sp. symbiont of Bathymodiolus heckerae]
MISIKQLTYALAIEEKLHFKKAAEMCHVSQSALSTGVNELEKQLGIQIFERDNKKVLVTPVGKELLQQARSIKLQVDDLQHFADTQKQPMSYPVKIGLIPTITPYLLPKLLPVLNQRYPLAQLNIVENQSHILVDMVRRGELDTAILALPFPCEGLITLKFWEEDFYWVTLKGREHSEQKEITADELKRSDLLLLEDGHCLKGHILSVCNMLEETAMQDVKLTGLNTLIQMVLGNLGSTIIPEMAVEQLAEQHESLSVVHLNEPSPHRELVFILRPNSTCMASIEALKAICKQALS